MDIKSDLQALLKQHKENYSAKIEFRDENKNEQMEKIFFDMIGKYCLIDAPFGRINLIYAVLFDLESNL